MLTIDYKVKHFYGKLFELLLSSYLSYQKQKFTVGYKRGENSVGKVMKLILFTSLA